MSEIVLDWKEIGEESFDRVGVLRTERAKVPGGWLVRTTLNYPEGNVAGSVALTFVPEVDVEAQKEALLRIGEKYRCEGQIVKTLTPRKAAPQPTEETTIQVPHLSANQRREIHDYVMKKATSREEE